MVWYLKREEVDRLVYGVVHDILDANQIADDKRYIKEEKKQQQKVCRREWERGIREQEEEKREEKAYINPGI